MVKKIEKQNIKSKIFLSSLNEIKRRSNENTNIEKIIKSNFEGNVFNNLDIVNNMAPPSQHVVHVGDDDIDLKDKSYTTTSESVDVWNKRKENVKSMCSFIHISSRSFVDYMYSTCMMYDVRLG